MNTFGSNDSVSDLNQSFIPHEKKGTSVSFVHQDRKKSLVT